MKKDTGIFTWYGFVTPIKENLRLIKAAGFSSVMLWLGNEFTEMNGDIRKLPALVEDSGLYVENAHIPYYGCDKLWYDGIEGEMLCDSYMEDIKLAYEIGIKTLVIHPFEKIKPKDGKTELYLKRMARITDAAQRYNIRLAIENLADNEELCLILDYFIDNPYVGLCFDSGHNNVCAKGELFLLKKYSARLFALHLHDNDTLADQHLLPYEGSIDWTELMTAISKSSYDGSITLESSFPFGYDPTTGYGANVTEQLDKNEYLKKAAEAAERLSELI